MDENNNKQNKGTETGQGTSNSGTAAKEAESNASDQSGSTAEEQQDTQALILMRY